MNNTHFLILDSNDPIGIFKRGKREDMLASFKKAIEDETGEEISLINEIIFNDLWNLGESIDVYFINNDIICYNIVGIWEY